MIWLKAAGIPRFGETVQLLTLPRPRALRPDEVLLDVRASGVGNWDDIVRTGGWDLGARPPLALGVEAAGVVAAVGDRVDGVSAGDRIAVHSVPLRDQGAWAEQFIAVGADCAVLPSAVSFDTGAALPVPALTADQVVNDALGVGAGQTVLVHGAGGVTGGLLVQLAAYRGATVIATASESSAGRVAAQGAATVVDYRQPDWPEQLQTLTDGGVDAAVNAVPSGAPDALRAVRDGGKLATITSDPAQAERHITVEEIVVAPDGPRLSRLVQLVAQSLMTVSVGARYAIDQGAAALAEIRRGTHGAAIVLKP
ncbi:MAG TPA: NADP-dependent oxidoreductase [Streptosporangiaceae bacterium]|nr:NADP-dependent oxidoreductase [Streptosporangiaceae bacterium]